MIIDILVAEIGSTTTVVTGFSGIHDNKPVIVGQGMSPTTVLDGDVNIGLNKAIKNMKSKFKNNNIEIKEFFATSSAAGGLKMTVHGLVYDMTVKAAKEAALGAGANIHLITAGKLTKAKIHKLISCNPNIILIAGGVDYGETETALYNCEMVAKLHLNIPVIYCGNIDIQDEVKEIFNENNQNEYLYLVDNVYPQIDVLNVEPTRKVIHDVFEEHIINAPGMIDVKEIIDNNIIPTPGAVMEAAKLLKENIGELIVLDVGGATTDIHSVTSGSEAVNKILISPEPEAKRTVEGDLGLFINKDNIIAYIGEDNIKKQLSITDKELEIIIKNYQAIPTNKQIELVELLAKEALCISLNRHIGTIRKLYSSQGQSDIAEGKDLTSVKYIIGTGGALINFKNSMEIIQDSIEGLKKNKLGPKDITILIDNNYIMAAAGVISKKYPDQALSILKKSLGIG